MARPLRLEYRGSLWHILTRGNAKQNIFLDRFDRELYVDLLGECVTSFRWILPTFTLMPNHVHSVVQLSEDGSLSRGMHWLNGTYAQAFNRRHRRVGHLFQGRFKSILVDSEAYYQRLVRYVVLNPVRAGMTKRPEEYEWSSHRAILGEVPAPEWLAIDDVLSHFASNADVARTRYRAFVDDGITVEDRIWDGVVGQVFLGSEAWVEGVRAKVRLKPRSDEIPRAQLLREMTMNDVIDAVAKVWRTDAIVIRRSHGSEPRMAAAWLGRYEGMLKNNQIAAALRIRSAGHVSDIIKEFDRRLGAEATLQGAIDLCTATLRRENRQPKA